ncbi:hypothetical protein KM043_000196 [Ampulex compressa]|nr:hypothetical protein KM043_000196 [Ampulex compressa]
MIGVATVAAAAAAAAATMTTTTSSATSVKAKEDEKGGSDGKGRCGKRGEEFGASERERERPRHVARFARHAQKQMPPGICIKETESKDNVVVADDTFRIRATSSSSSSSSSSWSSGATPLRDSSKSTGNRWRVGASSA